MGPHRNGLFRGLAALSDLIVWKSNIWDREKILGGMVVLEGWFTKIF